MPTWIDLTEHNAALNVYQTQEGKQLILRSLSPQHPIPEGVVELGFSLQNGIYSRSSLRFTLQEIQRYFPLATSRDFAMSEIFYVPAAAMSAPPHPEERPHTLTSKAPWQMTAAEWHEARTALHVTARVSASSEATRITSRAELTYGVQQWRHDRAIAGDIEAQEALENPITHLDVVKKALSEGRPVPFDVVAEYAELLEAADEQPVVSASAGDVAVEPDTADTEPTDQVASDALVKSARKKPGTERILRPHEASRFGRHGFVSEYFVAFEDGRFPTTVEALDRSQAIQFAKKERARLENRTEEHASPEIVPSRYADGRTIPTHGDEVFDYRPGQGGNYQRIDGKIERRGDTLLVKRVGTPGMFDSGNQTSLGEPLTDKWTVVGEEHPLEPVLRDVRSQAVTEQTRPWQIPLQRFLATALHVKTSTGDYQVTFQNESYHTAEKKSEKGLREVHKRQVSEAHAAGEVIAFEVLVDYPEVAYSVGDRAVRNVAKLLSQLGIAEKLMQGEVGYVRLSNPPYTDLVIERLPDPSGTRLYLTHYLDANGDRFLDAEMVFSIKSNGHLALAETAVQNPIRGGELRARDTSFANMFSKNLLDQGFGQARIYWPGETDEEVLENEPQAKLDEGMSIVVDIASELGGSLSEWEESAPSIAGKWRYATLTVGDTPIRMAVSQGGVVQVNGDPFTKDTRELHLTRDKVLESVKKVLPALPHPTEKTPYEYGRDAYLSGKMAVPAQDKAFSETFLSRPNVLQSLTDWTKGWHEANAANISQAREAEQETAIPPSELLAEELAAGKMAIATARLPETAPQRLPLYGINTQTEATRYALPADFYEETTYNGYAFFAPADRYRTPEFTAAEAAMYDAHRKGDQAAVKQYRGVMDVEMQKIVRQARETLPESVLTAATLRVGDLIKFIPGPANDRPGRIVNRRIEGRIVEAIKSSSGQPGYEVLETPAHANQEPRISRVWVADGQFEIMPRASDDEAFVAAREVAMNKWDNPHRIETLIQEMAANKGHVLKGSWAERLTFNIQVPESLPNLIKLMETHALPTLNELRNTLKIDELSEKELPNVDYGKLAESQQEAIRAFKAGFARHSQARIDDIRALDAENERVMATLEHYGSALSEAETALKHYEQKLSKQQAAEEQAKWEKYEPFVSGLVAKPAAAKIGFTKTWVEKDNGWFQVRNGSDPVWTNGHIFDLGEPHYTGFAKYHSAKYKGMALEKRPDVSRYLLVDASIQIQPVFIQRDVWQDHDAVIFERPGGGIAGVDKLYYDYVTSKYPGAEYFIANDWSGQAGGAADIVVAKVAGKVVAGLMPIRAIGDLTVSQIREKIDFYRPAPPAPVQTTNDVPVITREFSSKQRAGRRPAATGTIKVMQVDDRWYNAIDTAHNQGNHCGRVEPLTTHGEGFDTQFAALFDAGNRIVMEQRGVADGHDSMKTDKQRAAALEMVEWALQEILPSHQVTPIASGPYQGWVQAAVVDGEHRGVHGIGSDEKDAIEDLRQRLAYRLQGGPQRWRHIGTNQEGLAIEEDALGVRSILSNGVRMTESVSITPHGPRFSIERRDLDYLTTEELQALRKEEHAPESRDKGEAATAPHGQLADDPTTNAGLRTGDQLAGRQIDAFVDGTPVSFQRRRYGHDFGLSKKQAFTWGYAYLDGDWKSLGDPWPIPRPSNAELATAINYVRTAPEAFDSDAALTELNQDIERENAGIENPALYLQAIPTDVFRLLKLDGQSFEMRFKNTEEPFSVIIECQSPGVYLPKQRAGGSGPLLSLRNAAIWAMKELNKAKAYREESLAESNRELPRFITDFDSFKNLFGEPRDNLLTIKDVQAQYPDVLDDPQEPKFLRSDERLKIPADLVLEWIDERTVNVSIADPDHQYQVQIRGMDGRMDEHGRSRLLATYALKNAIAVIDTELTWERTKAARADGGSTLDDLAKRYAEFMHSHDPARHNGAVGKMHRSFALALADKDYDYLIGWIARPKGQNDLSKKFFTQATGIKLPKTARDITTTLYAWAGYSAEDALQIEAEKAQRHEQALQQRQAQDELDSATRILENTKVNHNGTLKTGKAFIDDIIEAGFDTLETKKVGAVNRYRLVNSAEGRLYEIKGSMVDYARHSLKLREDAKLLLELQDDEPTPALKR